MVWPDSTPPPASIFFSTSLIQSSSVNSSRSPASEKSCWAAKKVAEAIRVVALGRHVGQGAGEQGAADAVADGVHLS